MRSTTTIAITLACSPLAFADTAPRDLDPKPLVQLACAGKTPDAQAACRVARSFTSATPVRDWPPGGDRAWVGRAVELRVNHGTAADSRSQPFFLRVASDGKEVHRAFWNSITPDDAAEARMIDASIDTLAAGKRPAADDKLVAFVTTTNPRDGWSPLQSTQGASTTLRDAEHGTGYVRASGGHLVVIAVDSGDLDNRYATYIELWPVPPTVGK